MSFSSPQRHWFEALVVAMVLSSSSTAFAGLDLRIICRPCDRQEDCGDNTDLCLNYEGVGEFCGMHCMDDRDCAGLSCQPTAIDGLNQCVDVENYCRNGPMFECFVDENCPADQGCVEGDCQDLIGELGELCEVDEDCESNLCRDIVDESVCTQACDWSQPVGGDCPEGFFCYSAVDRCIEGLCLPGGPGPGAAGEACESALDCESLFCASSPTMTGFRCSVSCDVDDGGCPAGTHCESQAQGCEVCMDNCIEGSCTGGQVCVAESCQDPQPDGAHCVEPAECASGRCEGGVCGGVTDDAGTRTDSGFDDGPSLVSGCGCATPRRAPSITILVLTLLDLLPHLQP